MDQVSQNYTLSTNLEPNLGQKCHTVFELVPACSTSYLKPSALFIFACSIEKKTVTITINPKKILCLPYKFDKISQPLNKHTHENKNENLVFLHFFENSPSPDF